MAQKNQPTVDDLKAPLLAAVGAADLALERVNEIVATLRERAGEARSDAEARVEESRARLTQLQEELPSQFGELRDRLTSDELRKVAESYAEAAQTRYNNLVERGEAALERLRSQPHPDDAVFEEYTALAAGASRDPSSKQPGTLEFEVHSESWLMQTSLPYIIRDSRLAVVREGTVRDGSTDIPEGLYSIDVMTPSGAPIALPVQVRAGETTLVEVANQTAVGHIVTPHGAKHLSRPWSQHESNVDIFVSQTGAFDPQSIDVEAVSDPVSKFGVISTTRCEVAEIYSARFVIAPLKGLDDGGTLDAVPTAIFSLGDRQYEMSLPLNPHGERGMAECEVARVREYGRDRLRMSFVPGRDVCAMMDGLLRNDTAHTAVDLVDAGSELLFEKYADPAGAALGGLALHSIGRLTRRHQWVENLAADFPWLPDGQILCAAVLIANPEAAERTRGLEMLLNATMRRPLYTDGLSLAMDLLRRWPDDVPEYLRYREAQLYGLAHLWRSAEWDSVNLTTDVELLQADES
jgi:hypothetical protein